MGQSDVKLATKLNEKIKAVVEKLKNGKYFFNDVPIKLQNEMEIVTTQRKLGIRTATKKGYDVISNSFFVEESVINKHGFDEVQEETHFSKFDKFSDYYLFLQGDIYENACYYQYEFSKMEVKLFSIDLKRINYKSLITDNIDDYSIETSSQEIEEYKIL